jgi:hypothetical protein
VKKILLLAALSAFTISVSLFISFGTAHTTEGVENTDGDQSTADITGYAWSSNIGWISFNSSALIGCPTNPCQAKLVGNNFTGWAKATAANGNGWDGWIHLSGTGYGLTLDSDDTIDGYMWGGPVVGWAHSYSLSTDFQDSCDNGVDDDGDGATDAVDPDCDDDGGGEILVQPQCKNRVDDDGDGLIDYTPDPGCSSPTDTTEIDFADDVPEVTLTVGINTPAFEAITLDKDGQLVKLGIDVTHATTTTTCNRAVISGGSTSNSSIPTGGVVNFDLEQSLSVTATTKVVVTCSTGTLSGSDSVDIIIKDQNEF